MIDLKLNISNDLKFYAFKFFWRTVLDFVANVIEYDAEDVTGHFVILVRRNAKIRAYIVRQYRNGRRTLTYTEEEIDIELCPNEVQDALNKEEYVRVYNIS